MNLVVRQAWTDVFGPSVDPWWAVEVISRRRVRQRLDTLLAYLEAAGIRRRFKHEQLARLCACSRERICKAMVERRSGSIAMKQEEWDLFREELAKKTG